MWGLTHGRPKDEINWSMALVALILTTLCTIVGLRSRSIHSVNVVPSTWRLISNDSWLGLSPKSISPQGVRQVSLLTRHNERSSSRTPSMCYKRCLVMGLWWVRVVSGSPRLMALENRYIVVMSLGNALESLCYPRHYGALPLVGW